MKKTVAITLLSMCAFFLILLFIYIGLMVRYNNIPEFETEYSEEEHLERVKGKVPKKYLVDIKTEILYAYYRGTPEYVLITLELTEQLSGDFYTSNEEYEFSTYYLHAVIRIHKDEYYKTHISRARYNDRFAQVPAWLRKKQNLYLDLIHIKCVDMAKNTKNII